MALSFSTSSGGKASIQRGRASPSAPAPAPGLAPADAVGVAAGADAASPLAGAASALAAGAAALPGADSALPLLALTLQRLFETQISVYERASGWVFWTWKTESAADWDYQRGLKGGWITYNLNSRPNARC